MKNCFSTWTCALALLLLSLGGCGDASSGTGGAGGDPMIQPETVELSLTIRSGVPQNGPRLEGVAFCETDTDNCAMTDANGKATIVVEVPDDGRISYTYEKDGYVSVLRTDVVDEEFTGVYSTYTFPREMMELFSGIMSAPYPMRGTGMVAVHTSVEGENLFWATIELLGASGRGYYLNALGVPSRDLENTTTSGEGGFFEVEPGEVEVQVGGTAHNCTAWFGWPGSEENTLRIPVKEGFVSWSSVNCEPF